MSVGLDGWPHWWRCSEVRRRPQKPYGTRPRNHAVATCTGGRPKPGTRPPRPETYQLLLHLEANTRQRQVPRANTVDARAEASQAPTPPDNMQRKRRAGGVRMWSSRGSGCPHEARASRRDARTGRIPPRPAPPASTATPDTRRWYRHRHRRHE